jgi:hypothetical protein
MAKKHNFKEIQKMLTDQYEKRIYDEDSIDWNTRLIQKKKLKKFLVKYSGTMIPGKLVSLDLASYEDMQKYCPEAILLIHDLGYSIQLKIKSQV